MFKPANTNVLSLKPLFSVLSVYTRGPQMLPLDKRLIILPPFNPFDLITKPLKTFFSLKRIKGLYARRPHVSLDLTFILFLHFRCLTEAPDISCRHVLNRSRKLCSSVNKHKPGMLRTELQIRPFIFRLRYKGQEDYCSSPVGWWTSHLFFSYKSKEKKKLNWPLKSLFCNQF